MNETFPPRFSFPEYIFSSVHFWTRKSQEISYMKELIQLYDAIIDGKSNEIREMKNSDIFDYFDIQCWTNLLSDIEKYNYNPDTISALIYCIDDINKQEYEDTILSIYCSYFIEDFYSFEIITTLLENGADPRIDNCFYKVCNNQPIQDYRILDILIAYGANVNEVASDDYYTPYQNATLMENYELKKYLVNHGAIKQHVVKDKPLYSDII